MKTIFLSSQKRACKSNRLIKSDAQLKLNDKNVQVFSKSQSSIANYYTVDIQNHSIQWKQKEKIVQKIQQLLLMESLNYQEFTSKRVKERSIGDAYDRVLQWRYLFKNGIQENGTTKRVNLKEAADLVKVPKKTLEDYIQIFNKAELIINIEGILDKRMGFIRSLIKKNKSKIKKALVIQKQKKAEEKIKKREQSQNNQQNISVEQESVSTVIFESKNLFEIDCQQIEEVDEVEEWEYSNFILNKFTSKSLID